MIFFLIKGAFIRLQSLRRDDTKQESHTRLLQNAHSRSSESNEIGEKERIKPHKHSTSHM